MDQLALVAGCVLDELVDDVVGLDALRLGVEVRDDAVAQHGVRHGPDVVARDVIPAPENGPGLSAQDEVLAGARPGAPRHPFLDELGRLALVHARLPHELHRVADDVVGDGHAAYDRLQLQDVLARQDLLGRTHELGRRYAQDLELLVLRRVIHQDVEHETVELSLGQGIRSFLFDGVLRGKDEERLCQSVLPAADGHLPLLHRLEQRGLGLRRRAVDLVRKDHVGEHRAREELEVPLAGRLVLLDDLGPRDVARHEVGRELYAVERERERVGQRAHHQGLGQAGHTDQQAVAAREYRDEQLLDDVFLADDDLVELGPDLVEALLELLDRFEVVLLRRDVRRGRFGRGFRVLIGCHPIPP